jgi:hypothetical protein
LQYCWKLCLKKNSKDKNKVDKKQLVIDTLAKVFNYTEQEKNLVSSLIDYLFNNSQIKKMSYYKLSKNFLIAFTKKQNKWINHTTGYQLYC